MHPFPLPPPLHTLLPTLFSTPPPRLLFVAGCQLCCLSICCRRRRHLRLPLPPLLSTTLSMYFDNPPYPPLLMQICSCPHFPWLLCCFTAKNYVLFVRGKKEKRGRGPGLFCVGQLGTVRLFAVNNLINFPHTPKFVCRISDIYGRHALYDKSSLCESCLWCWKMKKGKIKSFDVWVELSTWDEAEYEEGSIDLAWVNTLISKIIGIRTTLYIKVTTPL